MQVAAPHPGMWDQTLLPGWTIQEVPSRQHEKRNCRMCSSLQFLGYKCLTTTSNYTAKKELKGSTSLISTQHPSPIVWGLAS